jgi:NitT/TauT family transport system ATP-binding protein
VHEGDLLITPLGQAFADASILSRKEMMTGRILRLPLISWIYETLQKDDNQRVAKEFFVLELRNDFGDRAADQFETAVAWGRFAELFAFDADTDEVYLEAEPAAAAGA